MKVALASLLIAATVSGSNGFDYEASKLENLKQVEECTFRVEISNVYMINGYKEFVLRGIGSVATIGHDEKDVYLLTNSHVIEHIQPDKLIKEDMADIRGTLGQIGEKIPESKISVEYIRTHAKLMDANENILPAIDLDLILDDPARDLALLSVAKGSIGTYALCPAFGDSDKLERGNVLYAFGYGKGDVLMTRGIYSGTTLSPTTKKPLKLMDGSITNGYSGSGVYALKDGKPLYVGLPTAVVYDNPKYGGFISSNTIRAWLGTYGKESILISQEKKQVP